MASVFSDSKEVTIINHLDWVNVITDVYYAQFIIKLLSAFKEKRRQNLHHGLLHRWNNAQAGMSIIAAAAVCQYGFKPLWHLPYSIDLATCDLHVFQSLEGSLCGVGRHLRVMKMLSVPKITSLNGIYKVILIAVSCFYVYLITYWSTSYGKPENRNAFSYCLPTKAQ